MSKRQLSPDKVQQPLSGVQFCNAYVAVEQVRPGMQHLAAHVTSHGQMVTLTSISLEPAAFLRF